MKRKIMVSLMAVALLCMPGAVSAAKISQSDLTVTVTGSAAVGSDVRLKVTDGEGELIWLDSQLADEDGSYHFLVKLPARDAAADYDLRVNGALDERLHVLSLPEIAAQFQSAKPETVTELIETYAERFGLDLVAYRTAGAESVNAMFLGSPRATGDEIVLSFSRSVAVCLINGADRSTLPGILEQYSQELAIDYENTVKTLSETKAQRFIIEMLKKDYASFAEFTEGFHQALSAAEQEPDASSDPKPDQRPSSSGGGSKGAGTGGLISLAGPDTVGNMQTDTKENPPFHDLEGVVWAKTHIENLYRRGVISGRGDGSFTPDDAVTREEFVAMIVRMFDLKAETDAEFEDVPADSWCSAPIAAAVHNGIVNGVSENSFGFGSKITRQDCAVICARVLSSLGREADGSSGEAFRDEGKIAPYAKDAVRAMRNLGVINGMDDGSFQPEGFCTRAMAAKIIDILGGRVKQ